MTAKAVAGIIKAAGIQWNDCNAPRLGAALAYYTLLSIAPLALLFVAIGGMVFDRNMAQEQLLSEARHFMGYTGAATIEMLLENAHRHGSGWIATLVALATLVFGASGAFVELRNSMNTIWDVPSAASGTWREILTQRFASFLMVLAFCALLLLSVLLTAAFAFIHQFFSEWVPLHAAVWGEGANMLVNFVAVTFLFALVFKFVPDACVGWEEVVFGAVATAVLFSVGKALLAIYLATTGVGSAYGAAGALIAFVVWVYYSAQILFFGAVLTRVYAGVRRGAGAAVCDRAHSGSHKAAESDA